MLNGRMIDPVLFVYVYCSLCMCLKQVKVTHGPYKGEVAKIRLIDENEVSFCTAAAALFTYIRHLLLQAGDSGGFLRQASNPHLP